MIFWDIFGRLQAFFALQNHWGESLHNRHCLDHTLVSAQLRAQLVCFYFSKQILKNYSSAI
jgi:hypothetical protein